MERLAQYWDDLDDLFYAFALISEQIRSIAYALLFVLCGSLLLAGGIWLALVHPPLASAAAILLLVTLIYHLATARHPLK